MYTKKLILVTTILTISISCKDKNPIFVTSEKSKDTFVYPKSTNKMILEYKEEFKTKSALRNYSNAYQAMRIKNYSLARIGLEKAISIEPNNKRINNSLGAYYSAIGKIDSAKLYINRAIQIDSNFDLAVNSYGLSLMAQDSFDIAEKYFNRAIEIDSTFCGYYINKAINYCNQKSKLDSCCKYINKAKEYDTGVMSKYLEEIKNENNCK